MYKDIIIVQKSGVAETMGKNSQSKEGNAEHKYKELRTEEAIHIFA